MKLQKQEENVAEEKPDLSCIMFSYEIFASLCPLDKPGVSVGLAVKTGDDWCWTQECWLFIRAACYFCDTVTALNTKYSNQTSFFPGCASRVLNIDVSIPEHHQMDILLPLV